MSSNTEDQVIKKILKKTCSTVQNSTWLYCGNNLGWAAKKRTVCCKIEYINAIPHFRIKYGSNFQHVISLTQSTSNATLKYEQILNPETKAIISESLLFGLQLDSVRKVRKLRKRENLIKLALNCTPLMLEKYAKKIATKVQSNFKKDVKKIYYKSDQIVLKNIEFSVNENDYFQVNFGSEDEANKAHQL
ncbi:9970_t:CDS:2 [Funneliformis caledonium]|uniref:9970_t:CDS:1 n=1 Tax=Funneliformis caledonium TaxID=1117310 RepID=A0A9N9FW60_9GLOM|nr:9970_t:CDS:2 [Funneliformis caledonium]